MVQKLFAINLFLFTKELRLKLLFVVKFSPNDLSLKETQIRK